MRVLFIGNDASLTGAPRGLLHLLRWLRANTDWTFELLLRTGGGPLTADYRSVCRVTAYSDLWSDASVFRRAARRLGRKTLFGKPCTTPVEALYADRNFDLIYSNTCTNGGVLGDLWGLCVFVLSHVHELESVIRKYGRRNFCRTNRRTSHYVAASRAVAENLQDRHGVAAERIDVVHEAIPVSAVRTSAGDSVAMRERLGIPREAFVVGGCGFSYHRKGMDVFAGLAGEMKRLQPRKDVRFLWVGEPDGEAARRAFEREIAAAGAADRMVVTGPTAEPLRHVACMDVFAMVSREDPFPYVNLEAAALGKPIVCFSGSGGSPELVEDDAGFVVPYLDVTAMAEKILLLAEDEALRRKQGKRAAVKVRERHDIGVAGPKIVRIVEDMKKG